MPRPLAVAALACGFLHLLAAHDAAAQDRYPSKPIQIIVPYSTGTTTDILARMFAPRLAERLGTQSVVVQNRAGAGSTIGTQSVATAVPDGHTLLMANSTHAINPSLYAKLPYDSVRDFAGVALVADTGYLVVATPSLGAKTLKDFIAIAKAKPGAINYASAGLGTATHLAGAYFASLAGIELTHVPYKNTPDYIADLVSGRVQATFVPTAFLLQQIKDGKLLALGVSTPEAMRSPLEVPSTRAVGINYDYAAWFGMLAPAKTPPAVVELLAKTVRQIVTDGVLDDDYRKIGLTSRVLTQGDFDAVIRTDIEKLRPVVKASGAKAD